MIEEGLARELRPNPRVAADPARRARDRGRRVGRGRRRCSTRSASDRSATRCVNLDLRRAELALGRGEHATARRHWLEEAADVNSAMDEPQFTGVLGALTAELERREGDLEAAAGACSTRWTGSRPAPTTRPAWRGSAPAARRVEADAAQRARDLGEPDAERAALAAVDAHVARAEAAADRTTARSRWPGCWSRAPSARRAAGEPDPAAYARAPRRPGRRSSALPGGGGAPPRGRGARAAGDRDGGYRGRRRRPRDRAPARRRVAARRGRGARRAVAARRSVDEAPERERDEPVDGRPVRPDPARAPGARAGRRRARPTARSAPTLFMAEKTASVHVSRILAKLDVRSRTEAAAVALTRPALADDLTRISGPSSPRASTR